MGSAAVMEKRDCAGRSPSAARAPTHATNAAAAGRQTRAPQRAPPRCPTSAVAQTCGPAEGAQPVPGVALAGRCATLQTPSVSTSRGMAASSGLLGKTREACLFSFCTERVLLTGGLLVR